MGTVHGTKVYLYPFHIHTEFRNNEKHKKTKQAKCYGTSFAGCYYRSYMAFFR